VTPTKVFCREKGFLAHGNDEDLWHSFQQSEDQLQQSLQKSSSKTVPISRSQAAQGDHVWIDDVAARSGLPVTAKFSTAIVPETGSACEKRIKECTFQQHACMRAINKMKKHIAKAAYTYHHLTSQSPLLNTMSLASQTHHSDGNVVAGQQWPTQDVMMQPDIIARLPRELPNSIAAGIAQEVAQQLPDKTAEQLVAYTSDACNADQTLELDDCSSFVQACKEQLSYKRQDLKSLEAQIRERSR